MRTVHFVFLASFALSLAGCGMVTSSTTSTTPGVRTIDFTPLLDEGPKLEASGRLAVAIDPTRTEQIVTSDLLEGASPPLLVVPTQAHCAPETQDDRAVAKLATYGAARVDWVELELRAEAEDGMPTPANKPNACVGVRDTAGNWHWTSQAVLLAHEAGAPRRLRARFSVDATRPITAFTFVGRTTLDPRSPLRITYNVVAE